jgi:hypothetical protein
VNSACETYLRGRVLPHHQLERFLCPRCGFSGRVELERGVRSGHGQEVGEVRVEYGYDPVRNIYTESTVVHGERQSGARAVYTLQSPLIQSADTAIGVARTILARMRQRAAEARRAQTRPTMRRAQPSPVPAHLA